MLIRFHIWEQGPFKSESCRVENHKLTNFSIETHECIYRKGRACKIDLSRGVFSIQWPKLLLPPVRSKLVEWDASRNGNRSPWETQNQWFTRTDSQSPEECVWVCVCVCVYTHRCICWTIKVDTFRQVHSWAVPGDVISGATSQVNSTFIECSAWGSGVWSIQEKFKPMFLLCGCSYQHLLSRAMWSHPHSTQCSHFTCPFGETRFSPLITRLLSPRWENLPTVRKHTGKNKQMHDLTTRTDLLFL